MKERWTIMQKAGKREIEKRSRESRFLTAMLYFFLSFSLVLGTNLEKRLATAWAASL